MIYGILVNPVGTFGIVLIHSVSTDQETIGSVFLDIPAAANIDIITMSAGNTPPFPDFVHEMADIRIIRALGGRQ